MESVTEIKTLVKMHERASSYVVSANVRHPTYLVQYTQPPLNATIALYNVTKTLEAEEIVVAEAEEIVVEAEAEEDAHPILTLQRPQRPLRKLLFLMMMMIIITLIFIHSLILPPVLHNTHKSMRQSTLITVPCHGTWCA